MIINQFCRIVQDVAVDVIIIIVNVATCVAKKSIKTKLAIYYQLLFLFCILKDERVIKRKWRELCDMAQNS